MKRSLQTQPKPNTPCFVFVSNPFTKPAASTGVTYKIEGTDDEPDEVRTYPWKTSFVVNIQETGGLAVDITAVTLKVQQASGGIVIAPSGGEVEYYRFNSSASGNRVTANGSASVGFEVWYDLPNLRKEAAAALGQIARPETRPFLEEAALDPDADVRKNVRWALSRLDAAASESQPS